MTAPRVAPKTGTTSLQATLSARAGDLAEDGVLFPMPWFTSQARAVRAVLETGEDHDVHGPVGVPDRWRALAATIGSWDGHAAVVSMEALVDADGEQIEAMTWKTSDRTSTSRTRSRRRASPSSCRR